MKIEKYRKILLTDIEKTQGMVFDIFIKLSTTKYVKVVTNDSKNFEEEIAHYHKKASDALYVLENDYAKIIQSLQKDIKKKIVEPGHVRNHVGVAVETYQYAHRLMASIGVNELELKMIDESIGQFFISIEKESKLTKRLKKLLDENGYVAKHSLMTLYLTTLISQHLVWHSEQTQERIQMAAFFKDIFIDKDILAKIRHKKDPLFTSMADTDVQKVLTHPQKAVDSLKKLKRFSPEIESLIKDHHELPDGSGFPRGLLSKSVSPLNAAFITSSYFAQEVITLDNPLEDRVEINVLSIFKAMDDHFSKGNYKIPYIALKEILLNEE